MAEEGVQLGARRRAAGDDGVLFRRAARLGHREAARIGLGVGFEGLRTELLEPQQRLGEGLGAEQRARLAVGGYLEGGLRSGWQGVFRQWGPATASYAAGLLEGAEVGQFRAFQQIGPGILRRVGVGGGIAGWWRSEIFQ
ncbi:hypothetical protein D9M71_590170 [compost metagenome]